jgi:hypothetical protein
MGHIFNALVVTMLAINFSLMAKDSALEVYRYLKLYNFKRKTKIEKKKQLD